MCLATSRMSVAQFFFTYSSLSFRQANEAGKISASTTISAKSTECLAIWLSAEKTCLYKHIWSFIKWYWLIKVMKMTLKPLVWHQDLGSSEPSVQWRLNRPQSELAQASVWLCHLETRRRFALVQSRALGCIGREVALLPRLLPLAPTL